MRDQYDDGGISGGTLERFGLKRLLEDIEDGLVDVVVGYKIDRLSRSFADFAKLAEVFDRNDVTFVSVGDANRRHGVCRMISAPVPESMTLHVPFRVVKRGGRKEIHLPANALQSRRSDSTLVKALGRAFRWKRSCTRQPDRLNPYQPAVSQTFACEGLTTLLAETAPLALVMKPRLPARLHRSAPSCGRQGAAVSLSFASPNAR